MNEPNKSQKLSERKHHEDMLARGYKAVPVDEIAAWKFQKLNAHERIKFAAYFTKYLGSLAEYDLPWKSITPALETVILGACMNIDMFTENDFDNELIFGSSEPTDQQLFYEMMQKDFGDYVELTEDLSDIEWLSYAFRKMFYMIFNYEYIQKGGHE